MRAPFADNSAVTWQTYDAAMDGIDWAGSAMTAARTRLDIATGNLANVSTNGFSKVVARSALGVHGVTIERELSGEHGAIRRTGRPYDLAIVGGGVFRVRDEFGHVTATRNGAFARERDGTLRDDAGRALLGLRGAVRIPDGATLDERGCVMLAGKRIDRIPVDSGATIRTGYLETANVDAIGEMVDILTAQRSFESAEKVVAAIDSARQKASNDVARLK